MILRLSIIVSLMAPVFAFAKDEAGNYTDSGKVIPFDVAKAASRLTLDDDGNPVCAKDLNPEVIAFALTEKTRGVGFPDGEVRSHKISVGKATYVLDPTGIDPANTLTVLRYYEDLPMSMNLLPVHRIALAQFEARVILKSPFSAEEVETFSELLYRAAKGIFFRNHPDNASRLVGVNQFLTVNMQSLDESSNENRYRLLTALLDGLASSSRPDFRDALKTSPKFQNVLVKWYTLKNEFGRNDATPRIMIKILEFANQYPLLAKMVETDHDYLPNDEARRRNTLPK